MKIFVDEEYGYRLWCWTPTQESMCALADHWDGMTADQRTAVFYDPTRLGGEWEEITDGKHNYTRDTYSGYLNINTADDVRLIWE